MAGNAYKSETKAWLVDTVGTLNTGGVEIQHIMFIPSAVDDDLVITDNADNAWIALRCRHVDLTPIFVPFVPPIKMPSLKIATIDGTSTAYIQFRTDI